LVGQEPDLNQEIGRRLFLSRAPSRSTWPTCSPRPAGATAPCWLTLGRKVAAT